MKLASHTRPARSFEPNRLPSCAVSSNAGTVPRTGSLGGSGVRTPHAIGQPAVRATTTTQVSGRRTAAPTAAWMRSRNTDGAAVAMAAFGLENDDQIPEAAMPGKPEVRLEQHGRPRSRPRDGGMASGRPVRQRDTREDRNVDLPDLGRVLLRRAPDRRRHPLCGPPPVAPAGG